MYHARIRKEVVEETCPKIDSMQRTLSLSLKSIEGAVGDLADLESRLEDIRRANSDLRDALADKMKQCDDLERAVALLEQDNEELQDQIETLQARIRELEEE